MVLLETVKRAGVFVFYDRDGIVDDYVQYMLRDLLNCVEKLIIVCNGKLTIEGRRKLEKYADVVYVRENIGLDAAAYRDGMLKCLGWDEIDACDEIVLLNDTFFGPFRPFQEIFSEMATRDIDFWGLTEHYEAPGLCGLGDNGQYPPHLQSYFLAIRHSMAASKEFHEYWESMPVYHSFDQVVGNHEVMFTKHFRDCGFAGEAYVDLSDLREEGEAVNINYYAFAPAQLLKERGFCAIKRKNFVLAQSELMVHSGGEELREALDYVQHHTDYDVGMIWSNLLRLYDVTLLKQSLHLNYVLGGNEPVKLTCTDAAVVMQCDHQELFAEAVTWLLNVPAEISTFMLVQGEQNHTVLQDLLTDSLRNHVKIIDTEKEAEWTEQLCCYRYVGFLHDVQAGDCLPRTVGRSYRYLLHENLLKGPTHIARIIELFEHNPQLGILAPPLPLHSDYYGNMGIEWGDYFNKAQDIAAEMNLAYRPDVNQQPLMTDFSGWFRMDAVKTAFKFLGAAEAGENIWGALCRLLPSVAQSAGYYSAWVMSSEYASLETANLRYIAAKLTAGHNCTGAFHKFAELAAVIGTDAYGAPIIGVKGALKIWLKKHLPKKIIRFLKRIMRHR